MSGHLLKLTKCSIRRGSLIPDGETLVLDIRDACKRLVPAGGVSGKFNVINAKKGQYLGLRSKNGQVVNFLLINPTSDGDIRWLLNRDSEVESSIKEVYIVEEVIRLRDITDLPGSGVGFNG